jgi:hypothetical protein
MCMNSVTMLSCASTLHTHGVCTWQDTPTALGERSELEWLAASCGNCRGVVVQTGPYFDAYIEVRFGSGTTIRWAQMQFRAAGDARTWVENQIINLVKRRQT